MKKTYKALLCGAAAVAAVGIAYAMDERFFEKAKDKLTVFKCRANSKIMEQALPLTDAMFPGPKVVSGADSAKKIPEVLKELNVNKVMIVTGPTVGRTIVPPIAENLERHGIGYTIYDQVEANPSVKTVEAIRAQYLENGCDGFLAIGGGSPMDAAKAAAARVAKPNTPIGKMAGLMKVMIKVAPIVAVPTTSGTGSEVTMGAVISDHDERHKYAIMDPNLVPKYAVLDPKLTVSMPKFVTATTGIDALTHAVESYVTWAYNNNASNRNAEEAVVKIFRNLKRAYEDGNDLEARERVAYGSTIAGMTMQLTSTTAQHSMEHAMSAYHQNLPHGAGLIMISKAYYAHFIERHVCDERFVAMARALGVEDAREPMDFIRALEALQRACGVADLRMSDYGISPDEFPAMVRNARETMGFLFPFDREPLSDEECEAIYRASYR